ncbi:hypothetical protein F5B22DRAFT_109755 [Xylaria bambusicola]|uniref:uncharacterized protein n=1 Tax=Xylaria bambusicola TaxID=326684 RepID=UPI002008DED9|nr:uncharacterized protein F5B22DRAFT_109755 [Xylaria bambusicola]KAI0517560.1 hypothetical protein F5B22DRAFT_109755 [Xylaria bambusicola]
MMSSTKKRSRWGCDNAGSSLVSLPTAITVAMTSEQIEAYILHVRIEEITQKLLNDDIIPANQDRRSLSPDSRYDAVGRRINTRHQRHRQRLEDERHSLICTAISIISVKEFPEITSSVSSSVLADAA